MRSRADRARIKESGWEGQVLCGVRKGGETVVPFPAEQIPDLLEGDDPPPKRGPLRPGGGVPATAARTNLFAATVLMTFLTPLLSDGTLLHHAAFFDARGGYLKSYPALNVLSEVAV